MRTLKFYILTLLLLVFTAHVHAAGDTAYDLNIDVKHFQLENGMLFLVVERPATPRHQRPHSAPDTRRSTPRRISR